MKMKETDLFKRHNVLLSRRNKEDMDALKQKISLYTGEKVDVSSMVRGMIRYMSEHPETLSELSTIVEKERGYRYKEQVEQWLEEGVSKEDIKKQLGVYRL